MNSKAASQRYKQHMRAAQMHLNRMCDEFDQAIASKVADEAAKGSQTVDRKVLQDCVRRMITAGMNPPQIVDAVLKTVSEVGVEVFGSVTEAANRLNVARKTIWKWSKKESL